MVPTGLIESRKTASIISRNFYSPLRKTPSRITNCSAINPLNESNPAGYPDFDLHWLFDRKRGWRGQRCTKKKPERLAGGNALPDHLATGPDSLVDAPAASAS
jgi:hypothetical protein